MHSSYTRVALGVALALATPAFLHAQTAAQGRSPAEIQADIDRLTAELEAQKQALAAAMPHPGQTTSATPSAAPDTPQDTALGKVVVRARNRLEPLQEVPLSISVVTGKELDRLQATEVGAITRRAATCRGISATSAPAACRSAAWDARDRPKRRTLRWVLWSTA